MLERVTGYSISHEQVRPLAGRTGEEVMEMPVKEARRGAIAACSPRTEEAGLRGISL